MPEHKSRWLIVFLIYADFRRKPQEFDGAPFAMSESMKIELNSMFKDILTTPLQSENTRLFVMMNGLNYKEKKNNQIRIGCRTLLYEIINPYSQIKNQFGQCEVKDVSITHPEN